MTNSEAPEFASTVYDYVIVGGGIGGLTLAARLSEDPNVKVGLLEAGRYIPDMPQINIPGYIGQAIGNPDVDWMFTSVPQKGLENRLIFQPRGKVLGGSSALNFMQLSRATADEYDALESLGNEGWNWNELLKYFKKFEKLTPPSAAESDEYHLNPNPEFHGSDGPLPNTYPVWYSDLHLAFLESLGAIGLGINPDPQTGHNVGAWTGSFCIDPVNVTRAYATTAFYEPNMLRENLRVLTGAQATKIMLEAHADGAVATGVEFKHDGETFVVHTRREVIISAGTFQTPQLLELSGIGDPAILKKYGIQTVVDLPSVGTNLQDHPYIPVIRKVKEETQTLEILHDPSVLAVHAHLYATEKKGLFSSVHSGFAMVPLDIFASKDSIKKMCNQWDTNVASVSEELQKEYALQRKWFEDPRHAQIEIIHCPVYMPIGAPGELPADPGSRYTSLLVILMHPLSRGTVHISSADPLAHPAIDPGYFTNEIDVDLMVQAVQFSRKLMLTGPLALSHVEHVHPGPAVHSDEEIRAFCKLRASSTWHPVGTASMRPREDGGVVDSRLLVYGTKNLRVVDASVIPIELASHIQTTVYAIAEKAADLIKADAKV